MGKKIELYMHPINFGSKAWFSLALKHKHKDIRTRRMAYLTQFSILALLNQKLIIIIIIITLIVTSS